ELHGAEIDRRMEAKPALERPERRVELNAEAAVDLHPALVVDPRHPEDDLAFGLADALDQGAFGIVRVFGDDGPETVEHLAHRLVELRLARIASQHLRENRLKLFVKHRHLSWLPFYAHRPPTAPRLERSPRNLNPPDPVGRVRL